jgi:hypothetical protein
MQTEKTGERSDVLPSKDLWARLPRNEWDLRIFLFYFEAGPHYIAQAGFELGCS